jgi:hypothetical protein
VGAPIGERSKLLARQMDDDHLEPFIPIAVNRQPDSASYWIELLCCRQRY